MLVLTRFIGQSFDIFLEDGTEICIKVLDNQASPFGRFSKIGIEAPKTINIVRTELTRKKKVLTQDEPIDLQESKTSLTNL